LLMPTAVAIWTIVLEQAQHRESHPARAAQAAPASLPWLRGCR
jgi:hypothetical protein